MQGNGHLQLLAQQDIPVEVAFGHGIFKHRDALTILAQRVGQLNGVGRVIETGVRVHGDLEFIAYRFRDGPDALHVRIFERALDLDAVEAALFPFSRFAGKIGRRAPRRPVVHEHAIAHLLPQQSTRRHAEVSAQEIEARHLETAIR